MESINQNIRWGWLKIMYVYTVVSAGLLGLGVVLAPDFMISMMAGICRILLFLEFLAVSM